MNLDERVAVVAALRCVDEVIPAAPLVPDQAYLDKYEIDHACLNDDFGDPGRQEALADLLEDGTGIVLPYTEELSTAEVVSRITGVVSDAPEANADQNTATVHAPAASAATDTDQVLAEIQAAQEATLGILGAMAGGQFKRSWLLDRERLRYDNWIAFSKCLARIEIEQARHPATDPQFVAALVSLSKNISRPGDRINLIGAATPLVGAALAAQRRQHRKLPGTAIPLIGSIFGSRSPDAQR
jgi:glycerol-3-phosphate cytidylyltransferase-like family protein